MSVELKEEAGDAAADIGLTAAEMAFVGGLVAAVGTAGGFPLLAISAGAASIAGAGLGIGAAGAALISATLALLAADPPREDFDVVSRFEADKFAFSFDGKLSGIDPIWQDFSKSQIRLAQAVANITTSFERLDGARLALRKPAASGPQHVKFLLMQRNAIRFNAIAAGREIETLLALRQAVNAAWRKNFNILRAAAALDPAIVQKSKIELWRTLEPHVRKASDDVQHDMTKAILFKDTSARSATPSPEILGFGWVTAMRGLKKRLSKFSGEPGN